MNLSYIEYILSCRAKADAARKDFRMSAEAIKNMYVSKTYVDSLIEKRWQTCQHKLDRLAADMEASGCLYEDIKEITGIEYIPAI